MFRRNASRGTVYPPATSIILLGIFSNLKMEMIRSSETSVHIRTTQRYITEDGNVQLTLWSRVLLKRPQVVQPLGSFLAFYGTRRFVTVFLFSVRPFQSTPHHHISIRTILMLSTGLRLGLPNGLFPSGFLTNNLYVILFSPINKFRDLQSASELYRLSDRHLLAKFSANFCG
jgi:hypothetical protein